MNFETSLHQIKSFSNYATPQNRPHTNYSRQRSINKNPRFKSSVKFKKNACRFSDKKQLVDFAVVKELDEETNLYYYGARYLDPRTSRWIAGDPAIWQGDYIPVAPVNDEARKHNQNLPGMGGIFNIVNMHAYHYAGNNPVKYVDPTGMTIEYEKLDTTTDEDLERVQRAVENVMNSDTEAGRRLRELHDNPDVTIIVKVTRHNLNGSNVIPGIGENENTALSRESASNNTGTNSTVYFNLLDAFQISVFVGLEIITAHELSGHAYDNYKGINPRFRDGNETLNWRLSEQRAGAIENEYRSLIGHNQRYQYSSRHGYWNMPLFYNGNWYLEGRVWNLR